MKQCLARFIRTCKFRVEPTTLNRIEWTVSLLMVEARFCVPIVASSMNADLNFDGCSRRTSITAVRSLLSFLSPIPPTILCYYYRFLRRDQSNPLRLVTHEFALLPPSHPQTSAIIENINHPWSSRTNVRSGTMRSSRNHRNTVDLRTTRILDLFVTRRL